MDEVYKTMFLEIANHVTEKRIEILNLVTQEPEIPADIAKNYKQMEAQLTKQLVAHISRRQRGKRHRLS